MSLKYDKNYTNYCGAKENKVLISFVENGDEDYILKFKKILISHPKCKKKFIFTIRYYISIIKFLGGLYGHKKHKRNV
jgi:hypothetical protein